MKVLMQLSKCSAPEVHLQPTSRVKWDASYIGAWLHFTGFFISFQHKDMFPSGLLGHFEGLRLILYSKAIGDLFCG